MSINDTMPCYMTGHKWKRSYDVDTTTWRCPRCKGLGWDSVMRPDTKCRKCGSIAKHPKIWSKYCIKGDCEWSLQKGGRV